MGIRFIAVMSLVVLMVVCCAGVACASAVVTDNGMSVVQGGCYQDCTAWYQCSSRSCQWNGSNWEEYIGGYTVPQCEPTQGTPSVCYEDVWYTCRVIYGGDFLCSYYMGIYEMLGRSS